ncbi:tetratricopeptide repeat protein [Lusitaniella coriacea]|uniref:tetratricopeptide repeat protein n=1 Tax=Lusitaniella coriacea TaxID=1983105 RepID=UPI003CF061F7
MKKSDRFALLMALSAGFAVSLSAIAIAQPFENPLNIPLNNGTRSDERETADRLVRFGGQAERLGNYEKAIEYWLQAADLYDRLGDFRALGLTYDYLGITYVKLGRLDPAELYLRRRLAIARDNDDFQGQVYGLNNLGTMYIQRNNFVGAVVAMEEALNIARSIEFQEGEGLSLSNLGLVAARSGNYAEAVKRYEEAIIFRRRFGNSVGEINTRNNLGDAYLALQNYREAHISYGIARQLAKEARELAGHFRATAGLARTYATMGEPGAALEEVKKWVAFARENNDRAQELAALQFAGRLQLSRGEWRSARTYLVDAIAIAQELQDEQSQTLLYDDLNRLIYVIQE